VDQSPNSSAPDQKNISREITNKGLIISHGFTSEDDLRETKPSFVSPIRKGGIKDWGAAKTSQF